MHVYLPVHPYRLDVFSPPVSYTEMYLSQVEGGGGEEEEIALATRHERCLAGAGEEPAHSEDPVQGSCYPSGQHGVKEGQPDGEGRLDRAPPGAHVSGHVKEEAGASDRSEADEGVESQEEPSVSQERSTASDDLLEDEIIDAQELGG